MFGNSWRALKLLLPGALLTPCWTVPGIFLMPSATWLSRMQWFVSNFLGWKFLILRAMQYIYIYVDVNTLLIILHICIYTHLYINIHVYIQKIYSAFWGLPKSWGYPNFIQSSDHGVFSQQKSASRWATFGVSAMAWRFGTAIRNGARRRRTRAGMDGDGWGYTRPGKHTNSYWKWP